jgi:hypothetical protein
MTPIDFAEREARKQHSAHVDDLMFLKKEANWTFALLVSGGSYIFAQLTCPHAVHVLSGFLLASIYFFILAAAVLRIKKIGKIKHAGNLAENLYPGYLKNGDDADEKRWQQLKLLDDATKHIVQRTDGMADRLNKVWLMALFSPAVFLFGLGAWGVFSRYFNCVCSSGL